MTPYVRKFPFVIANTREQVKGLVFEGLRAIGFASIVAIAFRYTVTGTEMKTIDNFYAKK
jgi:hypothetical protein